MAKEDKNEGAETIKGQSDPHAHEARAHSAPRERGHHGAAGERPSGEEADTAGQPWSSEGNSWMASAALIGVGALIEPELLVGMLLGAGVVYASRSLPVIGNIARPFMKSVVKVSYTAAAKASELIAEASEDLQDMVAEARTEHRSASGQHSGIVVPSPGENF